MFVKIKGTGSCLPEKVLDNAAISQLVDTNDEWIQSRTGIKSRHRNCCLFPDNMPALNSGTTLRPYVRTSA